MALLKRSAVDIELFDARFQSSINPGPTLSETKRAEFDKLIDQLADAYFTANPHDLTLPSAFEDVRVLTDFCKCDEVRRKLEQQVFNPRYGDLIKQILAVSMTMWVWPEQGGAL